MTFAQSQDIISQSILNNLHSKEVFDRVEEQTKKKLESGNSSLDSKHDLVKDRDKTDCDNSILSYAPNSYKDYGATVSNSGFFSFPRTISNDPRYKGARLKYKHVLHTILENAAFRKTNHSIGLKVIDIEIGQFCVSVRGLVDLCNEGVKYKDDLVDKNIVERASHFWRECGFVRHEVRHGKILLTVTVPEFYKKEKLECETSFETKPRQNRDSKETLETLETINISYSAVASDSAKASSEKKKISSSSKKRKKVEPVQMIERDKGVFTSDIAHEKLVKEKGGEEVVKEIYSAMSVWKAQNGIQGGDDFRTAMKWSITPKTLTRTYSKPYQPKYNHDNSPSLPSKSISFAEEI